MFETEHQKAKADDALRTKEQHLKNGEGGGGAPRMRHTAT